MLRVRSKDPELYSSTLCFPSTMYSPIKTVDHSKNIVRLNSIERELFQRRTRSMRRQLETCRETFSSNPQQIQENNRSKSKIGDQASGKNKLKKVCRIESDSDSEGIHRASGGDGKHKKNRKNQMPSDYEHRQSSASRYELKYGSKANRNHEVGAGEYHCKEIFVIPPQEEMECAQSEQISSDKLILNKLRRPRPPIFCSPGARPKSKRFSSASPSTSLDKFFVPTKPNSPKKHKRSRLLQNCQIRLEPGLNSNPERSLDISKYKCPQTSDLEGNAIEFMDSTQHRIKEFLDKTCADAARSRTKIGPAVSLSDLAAIDEQQTSMPILVEGVLAPEERKRQVSKVYPMRTPSPLHASHLFGAGGMSTRSNSRVTRNEHPGRLGSPLNLPPIILPPIRENKEFQPRHCSWSSSTLGDEDQPLSKPMTEEDWRSLRKCRYLRIPQSAEQASFMDNVASVFK